MSRSRRKHFVLFTTCLVVALLTGCGGSGSNNNGANNNNNPGGNNNPPPVNTSQGIFLDSAVEGLSYVSGSVSGETDASGTFSYETGQTVTFAIGGIEIGQAVGADTITPIELVGSSATISTPQVINILRFLQTLDNDGDTSNGIQFSQALRDAAASNIVDFAQSVSAFEVDVAAIVTQLTPFTAAGSRSLIDEATAVSHFQQTLNDINQSPSEPDQLTLSGVDTSVIGTSYEPSLTTTVLQDFAIINFSRGVELLDISAINQALDRVAYQETAPGTINQFYSYELNCAPLIRTDECDNLTIDFEAETVTFNNITLQPSTSGSTVSTGPLTISGTLSFATN